MSLKDRYQKRLKEEESVKSNSVQVAESIKPKIDHNQIVSNHMVDSGAGMELEHRGWRDYAGVLRNFNVRLHAYDLWIGNPIFQKPFKP